MMWFEARAPREKLIAIAAGGVLTNWLALAAQLAWSGVFVQPDAKTTPPIGISLVVAFAVLGASLAAFPSLRSVLVNQRT